MGYLSYGYKASKTPVGKKVVETVKNIFKGGKQKTTGTEVVNPFERKEMRSDAANIMGGLKVDLAKMKGKGKKLSDQIYDLKKDKEKILKNFSIGGIAKRKSNIQKIQEAFSTAKKKDKNKKNKQIRMMAKKGSPDPKKKKKFPDLTGDGKVTFADILKGRGVINGKKKTKKKII